MNEALSWIGAISGAVAIGLVFIFRRGAQRYVDRKAENLATLEDTAKITGQIEAVKSLHVKEVHAWKWLFEREYDILKNVWEATWEFQATARALRPAADRMYLDEEKQKEVFVNRHETHVQAVQKFQNTVFKNQPFIPPVIYEACLELRKIVIDLQVDFELTYDGEHRPDWVKIMQCGKALDNQLDALNGAIRKHIHGVVHDAQQGIEPDAYSAG